jgi:hypothetical protein
VTWEYEATIRTPLSTLEVLLNEYLLATNENTSGLIVPLPGRLEHGLNAITAAARAAGAARACIRNLIRFLHNLHDHSPALRRACHSVINWQWSTVVFYGIRLTKILNGKHRLRDRSPVANGDVLRIAQCQGNPCRFLRLHHKLVICMWLISGQCNETLVSQ